MEFLLRTHLGIALIIMAQSVIANDFTLQWCDCNDETQLGGYRLHYGQASGDYTNVIDVGNQTSWNASGLETDATYYFAVTAYSNDPSINESEYSNEVVRYIASSGCSCDPNDPGPGDPGDPVSPEGLVAAFAFEEVDGQQAVDSSGLGNNGMINGAERVDGGKFGRALLFDGNADWVEIADANSLDLTNGMTLEAWVQPTEQSNYHTVILKERTNGLVYSLFSHDGTSPASYVLVGQDVSVSGNASLEIGAWTHLAVTFDGQELKLFVNSTQVNTLAMPGDLAVSEGSLWIGGTDRWLHELFTGYIDEVRVYNRALSAEEIQSDMDTPIDVTQSQSTSSSQEA